MTDEPTSSANEPSSSANTPTSSAERPTPATSGEALPAPAERQQSPTRADLVPLTGSFRGPARRLTAGPAALDPDTRLEATLILQRATPLTDEIIASETPIADFETRFGADPEQADRVASELESQGLEVLEVTPGQRRIRFAGTARQVSAAFGTTLQSATSTDAFGQSFTHRHRTGELSVPSSIADAVVAVLGLDDRPQADARFRTVAADAVTTSYTPLQIAEIYAFPANTDGSGHTVAIVELGGGFDQADLNTYFAGLGIQAPSVTAVGVDGATNVPGQDPQGADGEVLLDVEVIGALVPAASVVVYFAPNTDAGFVDAVTQAAHATPAPTALSISWGQSEDEWTAQARASLDAALQDAVALGCTVTVAAGDSGSSDNENDGQPHVDFPASSPHALACGGTSLQATGTTVTSETVWNDGVSGGSTGGGVSDAFARPSWQADAGVPERAAQASGSQTQSTVTASSSGRGVPDVAGNADPRTGYRVRIDGADTVIGGTSAVAPLWAALVTRLAQASGTPLGLAQTALYQGVHPGDTTDGFRDITSGSNGAYSAAAGWDACTGLGVPNGGELLAHLRAGGSQPAESSQSAEGPQSAEGSQRAVGSQ